MSTAALRIFVVLLLSYFLSYFFRSANAVISNDLMRDLNLTSAQLGLMTSLFYLAFALANLPLGSLLDRYGPRFVHPALMLMGAVGALAFANAHDFITLSVGRAMLGIGFAAALMGALKAFSLWFPRQRYASISSVYVALGGLGAIAAATPLALLKEQLGWRGVFEWGALVILVIASIVATFARNAPPGVALPKSSRGGSAAVIWRNPIFWRIAWMNFTLGGGFLAWQTLWGGAYLFKVRGLESVEVGNYLFVFSLGGILGFFLCGILADRFGLPRVFLSAGMVMTIAVATLAFWTTMPLAFIYPSYALIGFTGGFNILSLAQGRLIFPPELTGRATTAINFMGFIGVFLLQWGMGLVVGAYGYPAALTLWFLLMASAVTIYFPLTCSANPALMQR